MTNCLYSQIVHVWMDLGIQHIPNDNLVVKGLLDAVPSHGRCQRANKLILQEIDVEFDSRNQTFLWNY